MICRHDKPVASVRRVTCGFVLPHALGRRDMDRATVTGPTISATVPVDAIMVGTCAVADGTGPGKEPSCSSWTCSRP